MTTTKTAAEYAAMCKTAADCREVIARAQRLGNQEVLDAVQAKLEAMLATPKTMADVTAPPGTATYLFWQSLFTFEKSPNGYYCSYVRRGAANRGVIGYLTWKMRHNTVAEIKKAEAESAEVAELANGASSFERIVGELCPNEFDAETVKLARAALARTGIVLVGVA